MNPTNTDRLRLELAEAEGNLESCEALLFHQQKLSDQLYNALKWLSGPKHEGVCEFTDKVDEGCYLCREATNKGYSVVIDALAAFEKLRECQSKKDYPDAFVQIIVNCKPHTVRHGQRLTYEDVFRMAFNAPLVGPPCTMTCSWEGNGCCIVPGRHVNAENGMIFNVIDTSNA